MRITLIAIVLSSFVLRGCGPEPKDAYSKVANTKVELFPSFQSYESVSAVSRQLGDRASRAKATGRIQSCRQLIAGLDLTCTSSKSLTESSVAKREHFGCSFLTIGSRLPRSCPNDLSHASNTFAGRESRYPTNRSPLEISSLGLARTTKGDRTFHGKIGDFAKSRIGGSQNIRNGI
jgi:hypothetical protein